MNSLRPRLFTSNGAVAVHRTYLEDDNPGGNLIQWEISRGKKQ